MSGLQPVRGTHDLLPEDMRRHRHVMETARRAALCFGYQEVATPIFEFTEVFKRTLGDTSDVVTKEMYTFTDKGGETVTLRPENTAGVARALISEGLTQHLPLKYFYAGPMFRYERPQKGRLRQFHQTGIELLGVKEPGGDIEVIATGVEFLRRLGAWDRCELELNTLGDTASRQAYRKVLVEYLNSFRDRLSKDSQERLEKNPMRVLDSKDEGDQKIVANAPLSSEYLTDEARDFFAAVREGLDLLGISYTINQRLVRGLDYYCHTCFEITCADLGAQKTVLGGGRYDGLVSLMGGPETPGVGWASGVERCAMVLQQELPAPRPIAIVPMGAAAERRALQIADELRRQDFLVDLGFTGNMGKRMKRANKVSAIAAVILGDDELARGEAAVKLLDSGEQKNVPLGDLAATLAPCR
ncbi:histidyl-tRNA synthetase [Dongia mobilis]|uniref:Histidine--tRNA ligase n=1 Tax=Dongia mobilis TaxID=578943 RepID=A0A4R6WJB9_9PROT|nr:histidine--tRNA ligase [Dongia mobilis]TDQ78764.1 histidyl-tRNA synthetase [Dongia mobilis]